jgi:hypothetical protein
MALELKRYPWQKMKPNKPLNVAKTNIEKTIPFVVLEVIVVVVVVVVVIDNHMAVILVQIGKNIIEDVLLNGGFGVNIITKQLKLKLGLPKLKPSPYNLKMAY